MLLRNYYNLWAGCFGATASGTFGTDSSIKCKSVSGTEVAACGMIPTLVYNELYGSTNVAYYIGSSTAVSYNDYALSTVSGVAVSNYYVTDRTWNGTTHTMSWKINLQILNSSSESKTVYCLEIVDQNPYDSSKYFLVYKDIFPSAVTVASNDVFTYTVTVSMQFPTENNGLTRNIYNVMAMLSGCPCDYGNVTLAEGNIAVIRNSNTVSSLSSMYPCEAFPYNWGNNGVWLSSGNTAAQLGDWNADKLSNLTISKLSSSSTYDSTTRTWTTVYTYSAMNKSASSITANSVVGLMQTATAIIYRGVFDTPFSIAAGETKKFNFSVSFQMPQAQGA